MYIKLKDRLFPKDSKIRHYLVLLKQTFQTLKNSGIKETIAKIKQYDRKGQENNTIAYKKWIEENEPTKEVLEEQRKTNFVIQPKISIVIPLYNTKKEYLKEIIQNMKAQTYSNWELCLADGSETKEPEIEELTKLDERIQYRYLNQNLGIAKNTNAAIELATGEYIGLLDHDDLLAEFAIYEVVKCINEHPEAKLIYSDEDKFSSSLEDRYSPHFKPDFAIDTLRSSNYICHFTVIKSTLMKEIGGFHEGYDGAQDYDLFLRIAEHTDKVVHIPKILYHWRVHPGSTAAAVTGDAKPYAYEAGKKVLEDHLKRMNLQGTVEHGKYLGTYKITYTVKDKDKVSILIPNKDHVEDLKLCIDTVLRLTTYPNYEIVVIENNSQKKATFDYYKKIEKQDKIKIIYYPGKEYNYSKIINYGVKQVDGTYILQLNNDTELLTPNWLEQFVGLAQRQDVGIVGAKLYYPDKTIQHAGIIIGINGTAGHILRNLPQNKKAYFFRESIIQNFSAVTGACLFSKKAIYEEVGYMNEKYEVALNDVDFCLKVCEKGYQVIWTPYIELNHFESKSRGYETTKEQIERYQNETKLFKTDWNNLLEKGDPFFNINFRTDIEDYRIKEEKVCKE